MLLFMDGMAHYATAQLGMKYSEVSTVPNTTWSVVPEGRYGNCIKGVVSSNANPGYLAVAPLMTRAGLWPLTNSGVCGFAFKVNDLQKLYDMPSEERDLFVVVEGNYKHVSVGLQVDGTFMLRGREKSMIGQEIPLAQTTEGIHNNSWAFLEFKWVLDETVGRFWMRVNGVEILNFTGNTLQQWTLPSPMFLGIWNSVRLGSIRAIGGITEWIGDLYLADLAGGAGDVKDFLGDGTIATIFPDGPGLAAGWTPATAVANWDQVNDKPAPDNDTTYVVTTAPGTRDCHTFENIPVGSTVFGAHYNMLLRKEEVGTATIKPVVGQGGVQFDGPEQGVASDAYDRYVTQAYDVNPATGAAWTAAEINAGQWGIVKTV